MELAPAEDLLLEAPLLLSLLPLALAALLLLPAAAAAASLAACAAF
jgi:hypothetical protein